MNLNNQILIAMPHLDDPYFRHALVYICIHDKEGAMGLIINRPHDSVRLEFETDGQALRTPEGLNKVYFGGPVEMQMEFFLHSGEYTKDAMHVGNGMYLTTSHQIISDMLNGKGPRQMRYTLGYAGWAAGQLERELENSDWLLTPGDSNIIFDMPDKGKWKHLASRFGIDDLSFDGQGGIA